MKILACQGLTGRMRAPTSALARPWLTGRVMTIASGILREFATPSPLTPNPSVLPVFYPLQGLSVPGCRLYLPRRDLRALHHRLEQFGARFGVRFVPHATGNPDRKAHVERLFHYIEHNFLPGRAFADWPDVNAQARDWCETVANQKVNRSLGTSPRAAFEQERPALRPLPAHQPAVCLIAHRVVDTEGYVHLETNRYSVPERLLGKAVEVYQYFDTVAIYFQGREVARHARAIGQRARRITAADHHGPPRTRRRDPPPAQQALLVDAPTVLANYVKALVAHAPCPGTGGGPAQAAVAVAAHLSNRALSRRRGPGPSLWPL